MPRRQHHHQEERTDQGRCLRVPGAESSKPQAPSGHSSGVSKAQPQAPGEYQRGADRGRHRPDLRRCRAALAWALAVYVCGQLLWTAFLDSRHPELYDPEFGRRLATLRDRTAETPGRPLLLRVGGSGRVVGFRPGVLPPLPAAVGGPPLVFNFSHVAAGPVMNLMQIRRLLRAGVRPDWLVVEVLP